MILEGKVGLVVSVVELVIVVRNVVVLLVVGVERLINVKVVQLSLLVLWVIVLAVRLVMWEAVSRDGGVNRVQFRYHL